MNRKTSPRKPNRGEGIISIKPRPKRAYDCVGLLYSFVVLLHDICVLSRPYVIHFLLLWHICAESAVKHQLTNYCMHCVGVGGCCFYRAFSSVEWWNKVYRPIITVYTKIKSFQADVGFSWNKWELKQLKTKYSNFFRKSHLLTQLLSYYCPYVRTDQLSTLLWGSPSANRFAAGCLGAEALRAPDDDRHEDATDRCPENHRDYRHNRACILKDLKVHLRMFIIMFLVNKATTTISSPSSSSS